MSSDSLTKIPDRPTFYSELSKRIEHANQFKVKLAVLLVDLDRFYRINEQYGYLIGDQLLEKFTGLLGSVVRDQDYLARIGDNTFALILDGIMNVGHAELAARKILRLLEVPFVLNEQTLQMDCTIAIGLCPTHAKDSRHLLKTIETSLRDGKQTGERINVAHVVQEEEVSDNWDIEIALSRALEFDEFKIFYQPKVELQTGNVVGAEALLRWNHPVRGLIPPDDFIPLAEETGLIKPITNWMLNKVLRQGAEWPDKWGTQKVAINIPPDLVLMPEFRDLLSNALNLWQSDKVQLSLEIIERSLVTQVERTTEILNEIKAMGIEISIDDFGTGYSSLSYFDKLPAQELKIDKSFIDNLLESKSSQNIVKLIVELAHGFDMKVVAEGVENIETIKYLYKIKCDVIQGYVFSKPLPHIQYKEWLKGFKFNPKKKTDD